MKGPATAAAVGSPAAGGHVRHAAADRPTPDGLALPPPGRIVAVPGADQGVGDLVQERVPYLFLPVALHEMARQFDGAAVVDAQAQRPLAAIKCKGPVGQAVGDQQSLGQLADFCTSLGAARQR